MSAALDLQEQPVRAEPTCPCCGAEVSPLDLLFDEPRGIVMFEGHTVRLTPLEMRLLQCLSFAFPRVLAKSEIYGVLYPLDANGGPEPKIVDVMICKLRKKIVVFGFTISSEWGIGYRLAVNDATALNRRNRFADRRTRQACDPADVTMIALFRAQGWPLTDVARRLQLRFREVAAVYDRLDAEERERREQAFIKGAVR